MQMIAKFMRQRKRIGLDRLILFLLITAPVIIPSISIAAASGLKLINANELKGNTTKWVILDARPWAEWNAGHIPGAIWFFWDQYTRTDAQGIKYSSFPPQELAGALARLGIDERTPVVVYGDADKSWGSEGYDVWLLSWLGHKGPIRLLNGGIQAWRKQKLPVVRGQASSYAPKASYQVNLQPQYIISTEEIQRGKGSFQLVDTRSTLEWIQGRIPGAVHIPWDDFYTGHDHHPLSLAEVKKLLAKRGVNPSKPVVYYCAAGVRSAYVWMVHQLAGLPDARNYKGSWEAWEKRSGK